MGIVKRFVVQSKVLEITIGMIVAVAFERVISAMVSGMLIPLFKILRNEMIGDYKAITGGVGTSAAVEYGRFVEAVVTFLIIMFFIVRGIKTIERLRKKKGAKPEGAASEPEHFI